MKRLSILILATSVGIAVGCHPSFSGRGLSAHTQPSHELVFQMTAEDFFIRKPAFLDRIDDLNQAIRLNPNLAEAYFERGRLRNIDDENKQAAIEDYTQAIRINSRYAAAYFERAEKYLETGDRQAAIRDFNQVLDINPEDSNAYFKRALIRNSSGDRKGATEDFIQSIKFSELLQTSNRYKSILDNSTRIFQDNPEFAHFYYRGLSHLVHKGIRSSEESLEDLTTAARINPNYAEVYYYKGLAQHKCSSSCGFDSKAAIIDFTEAIRLKPNFAEAYLQRGYEYLSIGNQNGAIEDYNQAVKLDPNFAEAYYYRGLANSKSGNTTGAVKNFAQALRIDASFKDYGQIIGETYSFEESDYDKQLFETYIQALKTKPETAGQYLGRGVVRGMLGDEWAIEDINRAIYLNPELPEAYFERARLNLQYPHRNERSQQEIAEDYTKAIQLNSRFADAYNNRGVIGRERKASSPGFQEEVEDFNRAIQINPTYAEAYYNRGFTFEFRNPGCDYNLSDGKDAKYQTCRDSNTLRGLRDYVQALRLDPNFTQLHLKQGFARIKLEDEQRLIEKYTQTIQSNFEDADAYYGRGWSRLKTGDVQGAFDDFSNLAQHNPKDADAYYGRGFVYYRLKKYSLALADYSHALQLNPTFAEVYSLRSLLLYDIGNKQGAFDDATRAIHLSGGRAGNAYLVRALVRYEFGDKQGFREDADGFRGSDVYVCWSRCGGGSAIQGTANYVYDRARLLARRGDKQGAIRSFQEAAKLFMAQGNRVRYQETIGAIKKLRQ